MNLVKITHPEAGEAHVPESAVPAWRASGWAPAEAEAQGDTREPNDASASRGASKSRASKGDK